MKINFSPPDITELEINEVVEALKSGWITTGPRTKELEKKIAAQLGTPKAVCLNSATAALEMSLRSEERRVGKECLRLCRSRWSPYH